MYDAKTRIGAKDFWSACSTRAHPTCPFTDCAAGHGGLRCEICNGPGDQYFDKLDAHCHNCGDVTLGIAIVAIIVVLLLLAGFGSRMAINWLEVRSACGPLVRTTRRLQALWEAAGTRYQVLHRNHRTSLFSAQHRSKLFCDWQIKAFVGQYQCISAIPSVYRVTLPLELKQYTEWMRLLEFPSDLDDMFIPGACVGNYMARILLGSLWPIVLVSALATGFVGWELLLLRTRKVDAMPGSALITLRTAFTSALQRVLPPALGLTFLVVPSTAMRIFRTFLCESVDLSNSADHDDGEVRRYLYADPALSCDSDEYTSTRNVAIAMLAIWPVGCPLFYIALLWASRAALRKGTDTALSNATNFLWGDYRADVGLIFVWEPLEMCRKLALTGAIGSPEPTDQLNAFCAVHNA